MGSILVVDDEPDVRLALRRVLERAGHEVRQAGDGREGLRTFFERPSDLVLLDVSMPVLDGWDTLAHLRLVSDVPVLMLTARGLELEKVRGLRAGADDYQTKPFSGPELLARVEALLRRGRPGGVPAPEAYADERLAVDFVRHEVAVSGRDVTLSPLEFRLLSAFVRHPDRVLTHGELIQLAWADPAAGSRDQLKTYVRYLRRKLGWDHADENPLESVRGVGYRYRTPLWSGD